MSAALGRSDSGRLPLVSAVIRTALIAIAMLLPSAQKTLRAQEAEVQVANVAPEPYTAEELDNLLAPVALYPDPILAQVLVAASFPEQIELAARYVRVNGTGGIDNQPWDISVRAVAHYAPVLNLLADRIDWTTALGQAHATQPGDVMGSVQNLRAMARAQGNLVTTAQQEVLVEDKAIYIVPAQPRVIYVPTYDPLIVYHRPVVHVGVYRSGWSFGIGFPIGVWLNYDVDWHRRHVYYHGWDHHRHGHRHGWHHRSRPYIVVNHIYVNPRHTTIIINRTVVNRRVHYDRMGGYNTVHRRVTWDRRRDYEDRRHRYVGRADRRDDGPSWDRNRTRGNDGRYDSNRSPSRMDRYERNDRVADRGSDRRVGGQDRGNRVAERNDGPSWDRSRRTERTTASRPVTTQRSEPQRAPTTRRESMERIARSQPGAGQQRTQTQRSMPQRTQPERTQPDRAQGGQRTTAQRSYPQRSQPQRSEPTRSQPQRERVQAPRSSGERVASRPQRSTTRSAPRSAPRAERNGGSESPRGARGRQDQ